MAGSVAQLLGSRADGQVAGVGVVWLLCNCGGQRRKDARGQLPLPASPSSRGRARMAVSRLPFSKRAVRMCAVVSQPVIWACYGTGTHSLSECVPLSACDMGVLWYRNPLAVTMCTPVIWAYKWTYYGTGTHERTHRNTCISGNDEIQWSYVTFLSIILCLWCVNSVN